ncbi:MAG: hypothetical protein QG602_226 [Verrucomicrobiota bacterium]|nr:hypothetical protein [Verrucomicrobiota bacterium]
MRLSTWRVGGEVTQRIANPCGFLVKTTTYPIAVIKTKRKQGANLITAILLSACVPTVDRADCTDGATWRDACDRDRAAVERPEPEQPGGHWATRDNEPDSRTDPEGHRDWQRDRDAQREEGTW